MKKHQKLALLISLLVSLVFGMVTFGVPIFAQYILPTPSVTSGTILTSVMPFSRCKVIIFEGKDFGVCAMGGGTGPLCKFDSECSIPKKGFYLSCVGAPGEDNEECLPTAGVGNNKCYLNFQCIQDSPNTQGNEEPGPFPTDI